MNNIVTARFLNSRVATAPSQWQYDYGQILDVQGIDELPSVFEAHFANTGANKTITQIGTNGKVVIPDECFLTGKRIDVYIYLHAGEDDGETEYHIVIPVQARPKPSNEEPTPVQQDAIAEAIAALNNAVSQTGTDVTEANAAKDAAEASAIRAEEAAASIDEDMIADAVGEYLDEHPVTVDETDPTVPEWAKQPTKPSYTAQEVGAVPAEIGKGLSTNDYTTAEKEKLAGIEAGADKTPDLSGYATETELNGKVDKVSGKGLSTNDYTTAEKNKLAGIEANADKTPDLSHYVTDSEYDPDSKTSEQTQPVGVDANGKLWTAPSDIPAVPVQSVNGKTGAVVLSASDVGALPSGTAIPSKTSDLTNDSGFVNASGASAAAPVQSVNGKTGAVELTATDVGAGTYSKPATGIPKSDLAGAVQTSLGKADTALQSVPSTYRTAAAQDTIDAGKIDKNQGTVNAGKFLVVGSDGVVAPVTMQTWQGGSY